MIKVLVVFGTRPEAIKMAPVVRELRSRQESFAVSVCVTAQHRGMLDQVLGVFLIQPDFDLDLMESGQSPAHVASGVMSGVPKVLAEADPDVVLVQGDTTTTFAAAFSAYLQQIPVGHIEAGLRTGNLNHPFPEEMNRRLTTQVATFHFAPTTTAKNALLHEGVANSNIFVTGNTVIDALLSIVDRNHRFREPALRHRDESRQMILVTTHRRESFGEPLRQICEATKHIAQSRPDTDIVVPVHPNPNVGVTVTGVLDGVSNVILTDPLDYPDFANIMARSQLILTDSGGIQEEAPSLNVPVLVLREVTERPEGVLAGAAKIVGTERDSIVAGVDLVLGDRTIYDQMSRAPNPYGDGKAAARIARILQQIVDR